MKPEIKEKWVAALRSGHYKQGVGHLQHENRFCCLGVLCDLAVKEGIVDEVVTRASDVTSFNSHDTDLPDAVRDWAGISSSLGNLSHPITSFTVNHPSELAPTYTCLAELNDSNDYDFNTIADIIEEQF